MILKKKIEREHLLYKGDYTNEISFPLGGIGTGSIGLAGNGRLIDWEIFNRPNKNSYNGFSFFAVKAEHEGQVRETKILQSDLPPHYIGQGTSKFKEFGFGVERESMAGFPHFRSSSFKGEFPIAEIDFDDEDSIIKARMKAFNPLIPLNDEDSSIPAAVITYEITNDSSESLDISVVGCLTNPNKKGASNQYVEQGNMKAIKLSSNAYESTDPNYGDITISTDAKDSSYQNYWYRGGWFDNLTVFWKEFSKAGRMPERNYENDRSLGKHQTYNFQDVCSLGAHDTLEPGETGEFRFVISWNYPNYVNFWNPGDNCCGPEEYPRWKNYYATQYENSLASAEFVWKQRERLYAETMEFKEALFSSTIPRSVLDAVSSNISILKSATCARLEDGTLYGFEGCHAEEGCCEGSCTHVWNYEQVTPFLFPALARSMRDVDYKATMFENGKMTFRLMLPVERTVHDVSQCAGSERAAADGQMGGIIKVYREWKISGDTEWLRKIWPQVKKALEFAWEPTNQDGWDKDKDGVMEGCQHHTLDVEIYGPNSYITGLYHTALLAASKMADRLGEASKAAEYLELYDRGRKWVNENLFNGEFYHQLIDLKNPELPLDPELGELKYQVGEGCHVDQVLGQWHSHVVGLGYIFDQKKVSTALESIYKYNFKRLRDYPNPCRIYALNDEEGLLICTWPKNNSPKVPIPYADECMNGFEYQAACHMIYEGMVEEGLTIVEAIRQRYNGKNRNPWNEIECGSNYARSMASYSLLHALSGFEFDMTQGMIGFNPIEKDKYFNTFWSLGTAWGSYEWEKGTMILKVLQGQLKLDRFRSNLLMNQESHCKVRINGQSILFTHSENELLFNQTQVIEKGESLEMMMK